MKKLFIIALAAVVAMTACTKVNPEEKKSDKISFTVANYMPQTKANSRLDEELLTPEFKCYAWQFTAADAVANTTPFMDSEVVKKKAKATGNGFEWAPDADYFWPKAGYINFYSYAGESVTTTNAGTSATAIAPTITTSDDKKTITFAYTDKVINATDNILVADPALHFGIYGENDYDMVTINDKMGDFDYAAANYAYTQISESYTGVPALFRHRLAKVAFIVKLKTADANVSSSTTWEVNILNDTENNSGNVSTLKPVNKGSLTLKNTTDATIAKIGVWDVYNGNTKLDDSTEEGGVPAASIGWVASTAADDKEPIDFATKTLTIEPNATKSAQTDTILLPVRTVMPQVTSGVDFDFAYQVNAKHGDATNGYTTFMTEIIKVSGKKLSEVCPQVKEWKMNQVTVYTITIDPVSKRITFDPAVVEWDSKTGDIYLPLASN